MAEMKAVDVAVPGNMPEKKRKLSGKEVFEELVNQAREENEKYMNEIEMYYKDFEPVDISNAIPIMVDTKELERNGVDLKCFGCFVRFCLNRWTLQIYDHPGDPRCGGFMHSEGQSVEKRHRDVAAFALNWYRRNSDEASTLELLDVEKVSWNWDRYPFYYVTFRVVDVRTGNERTFQAQVIEVSWVRYDWMLGLLRDATNGEVLAVTRFTQGSAKDKLISIDDELWKLLLLDA